MAEDMGTWSYTYASNGNLISQTDAKNQTINFTYDALNRLIGKTYSTGIAAVTHIPLVCAGDEILWVAGWRISESAKVRDGDKEVIEVELQSL